MSAGTDPPVTSSSSTRRRERILVVALCIAAAMRVFFFCAACPLFNNVDERAHLDLVLKYSRGHVPSTGLENFGREAAELILLYGTPEYLANRRDPAESGPQPPPWTWPGIKESPEFAKVVDTWTRKTNHEAASFPSYYALAGAWCAAGRVLGIRDGQLAYWIRFLDAPVMALLVWVSYLIGVALFAARQTLRLGLPVLVAFHPQDIFHSISADALSPLLFAASLPLLLSPDRRDRSLGWEAVTGLAVAATFLIKASNIAIAVVMGLVVAWDCREAARAGELAKALRRTGILLVAAGAPIAAWLTRNWILLGSLSGADEKVKFLTWTHKPIGQWWHHPIFTFHGATAFLAEITRTFWRGEVVWYREVLAHKAMDRFYVASSSVLLLVSLLAFVRFRRREPEGSRVVALCFATVVTSVLFMATISIAYDFGRCFAPSREVPYLLAGRLVSGALVPFLILYLDGLDRLLAPVRSRLDPMIVVGAVAAAITCSELILIQPLLKSQYNWFHL